MLALWLPAKECLLAQYVLNRLRMPAIVARHQTGRGRFVLFVVFGMSQRLKLQGA
jgi:hypothetical protein